MKDSIERINQINDYSQIEMSKPRSKDADIITDDLLKDGLLKARSNDGELQPPSSTTDLEIISQKQQKSSNDDILTD